MDRVPLFFRKTMAQLAARGSTKVSTPTNYCMSDGMDDAMDPSVRTCTHRFQAADPAIIGVVHAVNDL